LVDRVLDPSEQHALLAYGMGITNLIARTTASAADLRADELRAGGRMLVGKLERYRPANVAFLGISTYRVAFGASHVSIGPQPGTLADAGPGCCPTHRASMRAGRSPGSPRRTRRCTSEAWMRVTLARIL